MAVVLTLAQTKQIRINKNKRNNSKHGPNKTTQTTIYKYTYYQNTHPLQNPHIHTPTRLFVEEGNTFCEQNNESIRVKEGGIYSYRCSLKS